MEENINLIRDVEGEYRDEIVRYNDDGDIVEIVETPLRSNIITLPISKLMAGLILGAYVGNNSYWAVGTGTQASSPNLTNLVAEYNRQQVTIQFVDQTNSVTTIPNSKIVMASNWAKGALGVVTLSEFGIFSGTSANTANGGLMIDYVPHAPISLDLNTALNRKIYFQF